jgi:hypothetical protein
MDAASARALHTQAQGIATQLRLLEPGEPLRRAPLLLQLAETARNPAWFCAVARGSD